jgi:hypothetical protein
MEQMEARQMMAVDFAAIGTLATTELTADASGTVQTPITISNELNLSSLPGAPATLFLDFNGHIQHERMFDTAGVGGYTNIVTPPFDTDGDATTFSVREQNDIRSIFNLVAEDYAPFNINVTTIDPDPGLLHTDRPYLRVVISGGSDFTGNSLVGASERDWTGDYNAYADDGDPNVVYVFQRHPNGGLFQFRQVAEGASHESAHAFGVDHYSSGTGDSLRAPIMETDGAPDAQRGVWWSGIVGWKMNINNTLEPIIQDDMAIIASSDNGFGYRPDDHGGTTASASFMTATNVGLFARGVVGRMNDVDMFRFDTGGGNVTIKLDLANDPFLAGVPNLDAKLQLFNSSGVLLATVDDPAKLDAMMNRDLGAGTFFVGVSSHGSYGDVGQYRLTVTENAGAHIVSHKFQAISSSVMGMTVTFNEAISALTFTKFDVRINGGLAGANILGVQALNAKQFLITINRTALNSTMLPIVTIGPDIVDLFGNRMDQNKNGSKGELSDGYTARYVNDLLLSQSLTTMTTIKKTTLSPLAVDSYFSRF